MLCRNSLDNFENKTTVLWIIVCWSINSIKINRELNGNDYNLECIVDSFLLNIFYSALCWVDFIIQGTQVCLLFMKAFFKFLHFYLCFEYIIQRKLPCYFHENIGKGALQIFLEDVISNFVHFAISIYVGFGPKTWKNLFQLIMESASMIIILWFFWLFLFVHFRPFMHNFTNFSI